MSTKNGGQVVVRRLCPHGEWFGHRVPADELVSSDTVCPGPPKILLSDADLAAAFYDILTDQAPHLHPDLAGPKTRQLIEHLFNPHT